MSTAVPPIAPAQLVAIQEALKARYGIKASADKVAHILARAWPDLVGVGVTCPADLLADRGSSASSPWHALLPHATVNETYFLRERAQLDDFVTGCLPGLRQRARDRGAPAPRVLSAACSSGEEPYTLAILMAAARVPGKVVGVDIDERVLAMARVGEYGVNAFRGVPEAWREAHFTSAGAARWAVAPRYREAVTFQAANLLTLAAPLAGMTFDAIFCRNVLIYFERATQLAVIAQLRNLLVPGGYLFFGHSELFFDVDLGLEAAGTSRSTFYQRSVAP